MSQSANLWIFRLKALDLNFWLDNYCVPGASSYLDMLQVPNNSEVEAQHAEKWHHCSEGNVEVGPGNL